jgi:flagellar biosynthesis protein FliR
MAPPVALGDAYLALLAIGNEVFVGLAIGFFEFPLFSMVTLAGSVPAMAVRRPVSLEEIPPGFVVVRPAIFQYLTGSVGRLFGASLKICTRGRDFLPGGPCPGDSREVDPTGKRSSRVPQ